MQAIRDAAAVLGGQNKLADALGVTPATVSQWATGCRPVPIGRATEIELLVDGAVTRQDLRPDDWHLIWPELIEQPTAA